MRLNVWPGCVTLFPLRAVYLYSSGKRVRQLLSLPFQDSEDCNDKCLASIGRGSRCCFREATDTSALQVHVGARWLEVESGSGRVRKGRAEAQATARESALGCWLFSSRSQQCACERLGGEANAFGMTLRSVATVMITTDRSNALSTLKLKPREGNSRLWLQCVLDTLAVERCWS